MSSLKDSYRGVLASLLPNGPAWLAKNISESDLFKLLFSFAHSLNIVHCRLDDLLREIHPSTAVELNPEWENELYGSNLFDCIDQLPLDLQLKILAIVAKAFAIGGNRVEYFAEIAALLGLEVEITERFLDDFTVRIDVAPIISECEEGFDLAGDCDENTDPIPGTSQKLTLTSTAESLTELGVTIDADMKSVKITFDGEISDIRTVARFWEDGQDPTGTVGQPVLAFEQLVFTRAQALGLNIISTGANRDLHITQYDFELQNLLFQQLCEMDLCSRLAKADNDLEIEAYSCIMGAIVPAQLTFLIFVDNKPYDIIIAN